MNHAPESSMALEPPLTARQRLEASRDSMRRYLIKSDRPEDKDDSTMSGIAGTVTGWIQGLRVNPLTAAVVDAVQNWWYHHPLHSITKLSGGAARDFAEPFVRKYPLSCVGGALVVGVIAARIKPWRWVIRPALFAGLTSQIVTRLLSDAPLEFVLDALNRFKSRPHTETAPVPEAPMEDVDAYPPRQPVTPRAAPFTASEAEAATAP